MQSDKNISLIRTKVISGMSTLLAREFVLKIIAIAGQLLLVRLIAPEFFGIYAILTFIISLAEFFTDFGVTPAIIQQKNEITSSQISSLFILREGLSVLVVVCIFLLEPFFPSLYPGLKGHSQIVTLFSLTLLIKPMRTILISLLDRHLRYGPIATIDAIGITVYYSVAIILALNNFNIYSFVYAVIAKEIAELILSFYFNPISLFPKIKFCEIRKLVHFGLFIQIGNGIMLAHDSLIPLIGGRVLSISSVGFLDWSKSVASLTSTVLDNYSRVAFSGIAKIQEDRFLVAKAINKSIQFLNILIFLFVLLIVVFAFDFIHFIATDKWLGSLVPLQIFLIGTLFTATITAVGQGLNAMGYVKQMLIISGILTLFEVILAIILLLLYGFIGIPIAFLIHAVMQFFSYTFFANKMKIVVEIRPLLNSSLIFVLCFIIGMLLNLSLPLSIYSYAIKLFITSLSYLFLCYIMSKSQLIEMIQIALSILSKK